MDKDEQFQNLDCWAIVDLFGHQKIAGKLTTQTLGGAVLIRVDVPEVEIPEKKRQHHDYVGGKYELVTNVTPAHKKGGYTRFFGVGAIYSINPVSEDLARRALAAIDAEPVKPYELPQPAALPPAPAESTVSAESVDEIDCCPKCGGDLEEDEDGVMRCQECSEPMSTKG